MSEIKLVQLPVIEHEVKKIGKSVTERLEALNIDKQVATPDTVKSLKQLRAELNKELADYESQRKAVKSGVLKPYDEFEILYKVEISAKYNDAISMLKDKIAIVEDKIKADKEAEIREYWNELIATYNVDFVPFEKLGIVVNLSTTAKAYKEQLNGKATQIESDLNLINSQEHAAEILAEYKLKLVASEAILIVKERKEREAAEKKSLLDKRYSNRIAELKGLGFEFNEMLKIWDFRGKFSIQAKETIYDLSDSDYQAAIRETIIAVKEVLTLENLAKEQNKVTAPVEPKQPEIKPEQAKEEVKIYTARFEVKGDYDTLMKLKQYMIDNQINYTNI